MKIEAKQLVRYYSDYVALENVSLKVEEGELVARLHALIESILSRLEGKYLTKSNAAESVPLRVKTLRRAILEQIAAKGEEKPKITSEQQSALDELHMTLQLFSYPGDYVISNPTVGRCLPNSTANGSPT